MSTSTQYSLKKEIASYIAPILIVIVGIVLSMGNVFAVNADDGTSLPSPSAHAETYTVTGKAGYTVTGSAGLTPETVGEPVELNQTTSNP